MNYATASALANSISREQKSLFVEPDYNGMTWRVLVRRIGMVDDPTVLHTPADWLRLRGKVSA